MPWHLGFSCIIISVRIRNMTKIHCSIWTTPGIKMKSVSPSSYAGKETSPWWHFVNALGKSFRLKCIRPGQPHLDLKKVLTQSPQHANICAWHMRWHAVNFHPGFKFNEYNESEWLHPCIIIQATHPLSGGACHIFSSCSPRRVTDVPLLLNRTHTSAMLQLLLHVYSNRLSYSQTSRARSQATAGWRSDHSGERCKRTGEARLFLNRITALETDRMLISAVHKVKFALNIFQDTTQFYSTDISRMHDVSTWWEFCR